MTYAAALITTLIAEGMIVAGFSRHHRWQALAAICCANLVTHPLAYTAVAHGMNIWIAEAIVLPTEIILLATICGKQQGYLRIALIVTIANAVTTGIGLLV